MIHLPRSYGLLKNKHHCKYQYHLHVLDFCAAYRVFNVKNNYFLELFPT